MKRTEIKQSKLQAHLSVAKKVACIGLAAILTGCASGPYATIDGSRSKKVDDYSYDVIVTGIDGKYLFRGDKIKNIEPGTHSVRLTTTMPQRWDEPTNLFSVTNPYHEKSPGLRVYEAKSHTVELKTEPCKRYIFSAKHETKFVNSDWKPQLLRVEDIESCKKAYIDNQ